MTKKLLRIMCYILAAAVFISGMLIFIFPIVNRSLTAKNTQENLEVFRELRSVDNNTPQQSGQQSGQSAANGEEKNPYIKYKELYDDMKSYNERIYREGQKSLKDAWSYEQAGFYMEQYGIYNGIAAELRIPAMDCDIPLYLGATMSNMAYGAAQLGETSMPIGGVNTNCVIAAHRGATTGKFFLDIEILKEGDKVYIDNLWETLTYRVSRIEIISPEDINKILIEDGKDMITLITCHPYPYNYQRYAVFCERYNGTTSDNKEELTENSVAEMSEISETTVSKNDSSQNFIKFEETLYYIVPLFLLVLVFVLFVCPVIVKKSKRRKNDNP
ncbi:MAG: class C sortase [Acutalibacteraceae bacterium]